MDPFTGGFVNYLLEKSAASHTFLTSKIIPPFECHRERRLGTTSFASTFFRGALSDDNWRNIPITLICQT